MSKVWPLLGLALFSLATFVLSDAKSVIADLELSCRGTLIQARLR